MIQCGYQAFSRKRVMLLQGPIGPFFWRLAKSLRAVHADVYKINFNAGDWLFYPRHALNYRGSPHDWPNWIEDKLLDLRIEVLLLFGDCRPIHYQARQIAFKLGIQVGVFEEGYIRPDYITFEHYGVNGHSLLKYNKPENTTHPKNSKTVPVGNTYWLMARHAFFYFLFGAMGKAFFPYYRHHRPLSLLEAYPWIRSVWRKLWYHYKEHGLETQLTTTLSKQYFLAPLQVFNDSQVTVHGNGKSVERFIKKTLYSFALHAPQDTLLVIKHHPMDRGYRNYSSLIRKLAKQFVIGKRVLYIHDLHLPALLAHARGVVVINSTVGLSALYHGTPTFVCGNAIYDIPGLTYQGKLNEFWSIAHTIQLDKTLYHTYRQHLIHTTQLNGSFYKAFTKHKESFAGLIWKNNATTYFLPKYRKRRKKKAKEQQVR